MVGPGGHVKYLGLEINPWTGLRKQDPAEQLENMGRKISETQLKPSQKLHMFSAYAIPRVIYSASFATPAHTHLETADTIIRGYVKKWLHLLSSTCNGLLYSKNRDGGLALVRMGKTIPRIVAKRIYSLYHSEDPLTRHMARTVFSPETFKQQRLLGGGEEKVLTTVLSDLTNVTRTEYTTPACWRTVEFKNWCKLRAQGFGTSLYKNDKVSNTWLTPYGDMKMEESSFIRAIQMRSNNLPTLEFLHRGTGNPNPPPCRACRIWPETASHILGACDKTKLIRMVRHNKLCSMLAKAATKKKWSVHKERHVRRRDGALMVPDLILIKGDTLMVVDATVISDREKHWLEKARDQKVKKYKPLFEVLGSEHPSVKNFSAHGFVMGTRGNWLGSNLDILMEMGYGKKGREAFGKRCSRSTILSSVDIFKAFRKEIRGMTPNTTGK